MLTLSEQRVAASVPDPVYTVTMLSSSARACPVSEVPLCRVLKMVALHTLARTDHSYMSRHLRICMCKYQEGRPVEYADGINILLEGGDSMGCVGVGLADWLGLLEPKRSKAVAHCGLVASHSAPQAKPASSTPATLS